MKHLHRLLIILILSATVVAGHSQTCQLKRQTIIRYNAAGNIVGPPGQQIATTVYSYNANGKLQTMRMPWGQVYSYDYNGDTITEKTNTLRTETTTSYITGDNGKLQYSYVLVYTFANDSSDQRIDSSLTISNYLYANDGYLAETISWEQGTPLQTKTKHTWVNGNNTVNEVYDLKGRVKEKQVFEYYDDKPYQNLYPTPGNQFSQTRNLLKSINTLLNGRPLDLFTYIYEYNPDGTVKTLKIALSGGNYSITEFAYDCR